MTSDDANRSTPEKLVKQIPIVEPPQDSSTYRLAAPETAEVADTTKQKTQKEKAPKQAGKAKQSFSRNIIAFLFHDRLPLESETSFFVLVSVLDLILTILLLNRGGFRESNPVALYILKHWNINGMIVFKMFIVCFIVIIAQIVARKRPKTAKGILFLGIGVIILVLIHSVRLLVSSF